MSDRTMVVVGSGPGIGVATASKFASQGFNVVLISRNGERLKEDAAKVTAAASTEGISVRTYTADVSDHVGLRHTLDQVHEDLGAPEVVLFNAARVAGSRIGAVEPEVVLDDFKIINIGCYTTAVWALPLLESRATPDGSGFRPSFLITGGLLFAQPDPEHFSLSMQKAAQANFAGSLRQVAGPKGVHVATVVACGVVSDDDPVINAKNIANKFWSVYQEDQSDWSSLVYVGGK